MIQKFTGTSSDEIGIKVASWFAERQKHPVTPPYSTICWFKDQKPVAAVLFNDYTGSSVELHYHGPSYGNRMILKDMFQYVFGQLKCNILIAKIPRDHVVLKNMLPRLGFKYLAVIPQYFGPEKKDDAIMYIMKKEFVAKWVKIDE